MKAFREVFREEYSSCVYVWCVQGFVNRKKRKDCLIVEIRLSCDCSVCGKILHVKKKINIGNSFEIKSDITDKNEVDTLMEKETKKCISQHGAHVAYTKKRRVSTSLSPKSVFNFPAGNDIKFKLVYNMLISIDNTGAGKIYFLFNV